MKLAANITIGWADVPESPFCARDLHRRAMDAPNYEQSLFHQLQSVKTDTRIFGIDRLFRRTYGGFDPVLQFVSTLANMPKIPHAPEPLLCDIDLFAYAFLAGTRNFELLLPLVQYNSITLAQILQNCQRAMRSLEAFERSGTLPAQMNELDTEQYLAIRRIVSQPSAHQELQILAALLISGPSTAKKLMRELVSDRRTIQRILELLESIEILERQLCENYSESIFSISKEAIPLVMFCLKEKLGLDLMKDLLALMDAIYE